MDKPAHLAFVFCGELSVYMDIVLKGHTKLDIQRHVLLKSAGEEASVMARETEALRPEL